MLEEASLEQEKADAKLFIKRYKGDLADPMGEKLFNSNINESKKVIT